MDLRYDKRISFLNVNWIIIRSLSIAILLSLFCGWAGAQNISTFSLSEIEGAEGDFVTIDLSVSDLQSGASFFLTFEWDDAVVRFDEVISTSPSMGLDYSDINIVNGTRMNISWESLDEVNGTDIDQEIIARFSFQLIGSAGDSTALYFRDNSETGQSNELYIFDQNTFVLHPLELINGLIKIRKVNQTIQRPTFLLDVQESDNDKVIVNLIAKNFLNATSFLVSVDWLDYDIELVDIKTVELVKDENVSNEIFHEEYKRLIIEWSQNEADGVTQDEIHLATLEFKNLAEENCGVTDLVFSDIPERAQFLEFWAIESGTFIGVQPHFIGTSFNFMNPLSLGDEIFKCPNAEISLRVEEASGSVDWYLEDVLLESNTSEIRVSKPGLYRAELKNDECVQLGFVEVNNINNEVIGLPQSIVVEPGSMEPAPAISGGVRYEWSSSNGIDLSCHDCPNPIITADSNGYVSVLLYTADGCEYFSSTAIMIEGQTVEDLSGFIAFIPPSCQTLDDGVAEVIALGGVPPYRIMWEDGTNALSRYGLASGTYRVIIEDSGGESISIQAEIQSQSLPNVNLESQNGTCTGDGTISLEIVNNVEVDSIVWSDNSIEGLTAVDLYPGIYSYTMFDAFGCIVKDTIEILSISQGLPDSIFIGVNSDVVAPDISGGVFYEWYSSEGISLSCYNCANPTITADSIGFISVLVTGENGCESFSSAIIYIEDTKIEALDGFVSFLPPSCTGVQNGFAEVLAFGGQPPYEVVWSDGAVDFNRENLAEGEYSVRIADAVGQSIEISIEMNAQNPIVVQEIIDSITCTNDGVIRLDLSNENRIATISWSDEKIDGLSATDLYPGVYEYSITDIYGCAIEGEIDMAGEIIDLGLEPSVVLCNSQLIDLSVFNDDFDSYRWFYQDTLVGVTSALTPVISGQYTVQVANAECIVTDTINVTIATGTIDIPVDTVVLEGEDLLIDILEARMISWQVPEDIDISCDDCANPVFTASSSGLITAEGVSIFGCEFMFSFLIDVIEKQPIAPINFISPNNDGFNDFLEFDDLASYQNVRLIVINEWGKVIFDQDNYSNDWNGTYEGRQLPDGVYYYHLSYSDSSFDYVTSGDLLITH